MSAPPLPRELQIEVTGACNLRCRMCLVRYRPPLDRISGSMSLDRFRAIVDDLPDLEVLTLQGLGEPLLAPDLLAMVEHASSRGVRVGFNTNATLLTEEVAERLVRTGLDWLHVSVDGATAATYEAVRDRSSFARVERNVRRLVEVKRRLAASRPQVQLVMVAMRRNLAEVPAVVELAADWGVPDVWVQNLSHTFEDTDADGDYAEIRTFTSEQGLWADDGPEVRAVLDEARHRAAALGVTLRLPPAPGPASSRPPQRRPGEAGCDWPWRSGYVEHDGAVRPCCMVMGADRVLMGTVGAEGFADAWRGEAYEAFRADLLTDDPPEVCAGCSMYRRVF